MRRYGPVIAHCTDSEDFPPPRPGANQRVVLAAWAGVNPVALGGLAKRHRWVDRVNLWASDSPLAVDRLSVNGGRSGGGAEPGTQHNWITGR